MKGLTAGSIARDGAASAPRQARTHPAISLTKPPILVLRLDQLQSQARLLDDPAAVIVDARHQTPQLNVLARILVLRRRIRACGGDLVLVAGPATVDLLRRYGLDRSVPCHDDLTAAASVIDHERGRAV